MSGSKLEMRGGGAGWVRKGKLNEPFTVRRNTVSPFVELRLLRKSAGELVDCLGEPCEIVVCRTE